VDEDAEDEGRSGREGERWALQHPLAGDPDKVGMDSEGEGRWPCIHDL
jgi:hypothetical protein